MPLKLPSCRGPLPAASLMSLSLLLAACGGSDNNSSPSPTLTGTAAVGAAIPGANVSVKCQNSTSSFTTTTGSNGTYGMVVPGTAFPCAVRVSGGSLGSNALHSYASAAGTTNVTPLTDLALALQVNTTASQAIADWFNDIGGTGINSQWSNISGNLANAIDDLRSALVAAGYSVPATWTANSTAPFTASFTPNPASDPFDQLLDALAISINDAGSGFADYNALLSAFVTSPGTSLPPDTSPPVDSGGDTQPASVHASLAKSYSLKFSGTCGSECNFANGQTYTATVAGNSLIINGKTLTNPVNQKVGGSFNLNEIIWADGNLRYALSNNQTGVFNEINVGDASQPVSGLPKFLGQFTVESAPTTPLAAIQALADSYVYEVQATGTAVGDLGIISRGLRIDTGYPACAPIGQSDTSKRWKARIVIGSNGSVSIQNTGNASQTITLTPGSAGADDNTTVGLYPYSTTWSMANPGSKIYEIKRAIRYNDGVHPTPLTEYFSIQLGVDSSGKLGNVGLQGLADSPRMAFCPVSSLLPEPTDFLAPLKALAGSYTIGHDYLTDSPNWTTPGWTGVSIGTNGSVTFSGNGPSFSPSEIIGLRVNRRNDSNYGPDNSIWGLIALINRDINGDGSINEQDRVNFFLTETGQLRDIQYKDSSTHLVEVSVLGRQLPAYDNTLSSSLTGNGVSGQIDGEAFSVSSTETFTRIEVYNSGRVDFFAGRNKFPDVPANERRAWRITVGTTALETGTPYPCANGNPGSIYSGSAVLFDSSYGILTSAGAGFAVQPSHNSRAGGDCEITLSAVTKNGSGILTGVEGKFRATVWVSSEKKYVPAVGFFRLTAP